MSTPRKLVFVALLAGLSSAFAAAPTTKAPAPRATATRDAATATAPAKEKVSPHDHLAFHKGIPGAPAAAVPAQGPARPLYERMKTHP